jgi:hypothetical protein
MNAHINFDLGIAAVETAAGSDLQSIQNDFNSINTILAALTYQVINEIDRVSPLLSLLGFHATNYQSILIQFTISSARDGAWAFAETLCNQKGSAYESSIADRDKNIRKLGMAMIHPALAIRFTIWVIHLFEWKKPSAIIKSLDQYKKKYLKASELGS